jgi:hypothetical protein
MSEESDRAGGEEATPNRGRRREPPIIDAQANETPAAKPARARGAGVALLAALLALAGAGASLWFTLNARESGAASDASAALAQRLDRLERRVGALENKPAPNIPDTAPLAARIASIDTKADRIAAEATRAAQMAEEALRKPSTPATSEPHIDLAPLDKRISALEQRPVPQIDDTRLTKIENDLASVRKNADSAERNRGPAMAIVATSLQQKLDRGESFAREIAALEKLGADPKLIASLKPLAANGATPPQKLAQDFSNRSSAILRAAQPAPEGEDILDRIGRSAASLVRIRPAGDSTQENAPALISRIEAALQRNDVAIAMTLFDKLPAAAQDQARDWAQLAKARAQADAAARTLVAQTIDMIAEK